MTQLIIYAGAQPSVWARVRAHGLATVRATIWMVALFAQWFLYATLLNSSWRLACTCMKLFTYSESESLLSMLVGTDGPASTPTSAAQAAATTTLDAILTLVRRTATGDVDPVMLFNGKMTPLLTTSIDFSAANLVNHSSTLSPTMSIRTVMSGLARGCLMVACIFLILMVVKSLRAAVEALGGEKKQITDLAVIATALTHPEAQTRGIETAFQSASDECIYNTSTSAAIESDSEQELSGVTLAPPCTPSGSLSNLKAIDTTETRSEKLCALPLPDSQTKAQATPALNPSAPVFKPRAPPMLKRRHAVLDLSQPLTPATDSAASTPGPLTPTTPSPAPAPIPTHFTRRPPVTPRRSGPTVSDVKPRSRVFAPVVRGPDGLVRVLAPGGMPLVVEPAVVAADMFYRA